MQIGTTLGPYEVTGSLGAGGMGEVYRPRDGTELYFRSTDDLMAVSIAGDESSIVETPRPLFDDRFVRAQSPSNHTTYDVTHDGRFLMLESVAGLDRIEVVANWFEELRARIA